MSRNLTKPAPGPLDAFARLRRTTPARIGLGRTGDSLPLPAQLDLQEAHARARDAVHGRADFAAIAEALAPLQCGLVRSQAADRSIYLRRPDLGRRVHPEDHSGLAMHAGEWDLAIVVADGLSADAVAAHAVPTIKAVVELAPELHLGPVVLAEQGRVAIGDEIGALLGVRLVAVLIGERPGLTVSDSLGIYLTWEPRIGRADSERNCISNIHARGLSHAEAARLVLAIADKAREIGGTGVSLKLDGPTQPTGLPKSFAPTCSDGRRFS